MRVRRDLRATHRVIDALRVLALQTKLYVVWHVVRLGRLADVHRQGPGEDDERLLLLLVPVAAAPRAGLD